MLAIAHEPRNPRSMALAIAFSGSAIVHALIFTPLVGAALFGSSSAPMAPMMAPRPAEPPPKFETPRERHEREEEEVRLGIANSSKISVNWIGYDEYEEHYAAKAENDQAALRLA